jgi:hypothetical protein
MDTGWFDHNNLLNQLAASARRHPVMESIPDFPECSNPGPGTRGCKLVCVLVKVSHTPAGWIRRHANLSRFRFQQTKKICILAKRFRAALAKNNVARRSGRGRKFKSRSGHWLNGYAETAAAVPPVLSEPSLTKQRGFSLQQGAVQARSFLRAPGINSGCESGSQQLRTVSPGQSQRCCEHTSRTEVNGRMG